MAKGEGGFPPDVQTRALLATQVARVAVVLLSLDMLYDAIDYRKMLREDRLGLRGFLSKKRHVG